MFKTIFHERLYIAMHSRGVKQVELSNLTGINKSQICEYCSGKCKPKQDKLYLIAHALNVNPMWLLGFNVSMEIEKIDIKKKVLDRIDTLTVDDLYKLDSIIDNFFEQK